VILFVKGVNMKKYIRLENIDDINRFVDVYYNETGYDSLNHFYNFLVTGIYKPPVIVELDDIVTHDLHFMSLEGIKESNSERYNKWVLKAIPLRAYENPQKYPEFFI
jgi:hypothetical protein